MDVTTFSEQIFFVTARLSAALSADRTMVGTGFVYSVETTQGTAHFLVTNRHVVEASEVLTITMIAAEDEMHPRLGHAVQVNLQEVTVDFYVSHPDPAVDVAVLPFSAVLNHMTQEMKAPAFFRAVPSTMSLTADKATDLDAIEEVVFVGYPNGLFDTQNLLPIARRGSTATPLSIDYQGKPSFLIDASVFPGSSGSPVFSVDSGIHRSKTGGIAIGGRPPIFLGVLAAVAVRWADEQIVRTTTSDPAIGFQEPIDLGIVFKASAIEQCVDPLLAKSGLVRAGEAQTMTVVPSAADEQLAGELPDTPKASD